MQEVSSALCSCFLLLETPIFLSSAPSSLLPDTCLLSLHFPSSVCKAALFRGDLLESAWFSCALGSDLFSLFRLILLFIVMILGGQGDISGYLYLPQLGAFEMCLATQGIAFDLVETKFDTN